MGLLGWFTAFPDDRIRLERQGGSSTALLPETTARNLRGRAGNRGLLAGATGAGNGHGQAVALQVAGA